MGNGDAVGVVVGVFYSGGGIAVVDVVINAGNGDSLRGTPVGGSEGERCFIEGAFCCIVTC